MELELGVTIDDSYDLDENSIKTIKRAYTSTLVEYARQICDQDNPNKLSLSKVNF